MVKKSDLKKLNSIMQEGNEFKNLKEYNKAVEKYLEALRFVEEKVKETEEREMKILIPLSIYSTKQRELPTR